MFWKLTVTPIRTSLLPGELLGLLPHLGGVQEVGGDLHVAGGHLVYALWDGDGGAAALARGAAGGVAARAAWRHFGRHRGGHPDRFTAGQEEEVVREVRQSHEVLSVIEFHILIHLFMKQEATSCCKCLTDVHDSY